MATPHWGQMLQMIGPTTQLNSKKFEKIPVPEICRIRKKAAAGILREFRKNGPVEIWQNSKSINFREEIMTLGAPLLQP
jgi:hypothetical protein